MNWRDWMPRDVYEAVGCVVFPTLALAVLTAAVVLLIVALQGLA